MTSKRKDESDKLLYCPSYDKSQHEVCKLIAGSSMCIYDECVDLCSDIIREEIKEVAPHRERSTLSTPHEIHHHLDNYIIGQEQAKKMLVATVCNRYKRLRNGGTSNGVELSKSNILLIGPTGSGKTLLAETLTYLLDISFIMADAITLTKADYVGEDVENIIQELLQRCDCDMQKAQHDIVYVDEINKISRKSDSPSITRNASGEGVQQALLKLIEDTVAVVPPQGGHRHPQQELLQTDTSKILLICSGALAGLDGVISYRVETGSDAGFGATVKAKSDKASEGELLVQAGPEGLIKFGLIPEFTGRLPVVTILNELSGEALIRILKEPRNALTKQYQTLFSLEGTELESHDEVLDVIAKRTMARKTGAYGLRLIVEVALLDTMYDPPSVDGIERVVIDKLVIEGQNKLLLIYDKPGAQQASGEQLTISLRQLTKRGDFIPPSIFSAFPPLNVWNTSPYIGLYTNGDAVEYDVVGYLADFKLRGSSMSPERSGRTEIPVLPLRSVVVYSHMVIPLPVGREKSIRCLKAAVDHDKKIMLVVQKGALADESGVNDLFTVGTVASILWMSKLLDGTVKMLVERLQCAHISALSDNGEHFSAKAEHLDSPAIDERGWEVLVHAAISQSEDYIKLNKKVPPEVLTSLDSIDDPARLADTIAAHMPLRLTGKQSVLEMSDVSGHLEYLMAMVESEINLLQVEKRIRNCTKKQMEKSQCGYYLNE